MTLTVFTIWYLYLYNFKERYRNLAEHLVFATVLDFWLVSALGLFLPEVCRITVETGTICGFRGYVKHCHGNSM